MDADMMTRAAKAWNEQSPGVPFLRRKEAATALRMSVTKLDRIIATGELKAKKMGHAVVVMPAEITRYIAQLADVIPRAERSAPGD
ncbi:helix-turn-helix domain-containing protein [Bradyrhizobium barranii]|uniref:Helix-turn-helix domain-containing protein n=1 Tax=Bradyrhizobium barranii TaxID=2992140 RepID=A0ABY3QWQ4_9BRAD|nr:helix-turn-helix domain-containing protein [Bradyrhizobium japonicum]UFW90464.1 helix-turn-helix domain-containing protein [Bradyrhizobium japonicum]